MIIRIFRARVSPGKNVLWQEQVEKYSIPWLKAQPGMQSCFPGKPLSEDRYEYVMVSVWKNLESLRRAIGDDLQRVVLLEDEAELVEETSVEHYQIFDQ